MLTGAERAAETGHFESYEPGAFIPSPPSCPLEEDQWSGTRLPETEVLSKAHSFVRFADFSHLFRYSLEESEPQLPLETGWIQGEDAKPLIDKMCSFDELTSSLGATFGINSSLRLFGVSVNPPGQFTLTPSDENQGLLVGLHTDNLSFVSFEQFPKNRRVCVNVGTGTRHLLIRDQNLSSLAELARRTIGSEDHQEPTGFKRFYRSAQETDFSVPILWLPQPRGWAYYATTDQLIHDGSTYNLEDTDLDVTIVFIEDCK